MPKLPPPPRSAQNRSGYDSAVTSRISPSAVTSSTATRLSAASPYFAMSQPSPPPSVKPGYPGCRDRTTGDGEAVLRRRVVELAPGHAPLGGDDTCLGVDGRALHLGQVDHHSPRRRRRAPRRCAPRRAPRCRRQRPGRSGPRPRRPPRSDSGRSGRGAGRSCRCGRVSRRRSRRVPAAGPSRSRRP